MPARTLPCIIVWMTRPYAVSYFNQNGNSKPCLSGRFIHFSTHISNRIRVNCTNVPASLLVGRANNRGNRTTPERWLRGSFNRNDAYDNFDYELIAAEGISRENGAVAFLAWGARQ